MYKPGDLVIFTDSRLRDFERLGIVLEAHDCDSEGFLWEVSTPGRGPMPYAADEIRPAEQADIDAHHPSWVEFVHADYAWRTGKVSARPGRLHCT